MRRGIETVVGYLLLLAVGIAVLIAVSSSSINLISKSNPEPVTGRVDIVVCGKTIMVYNLGNTPVTLNLTIIMVNGNVDHMTVSIPPGGNRYIWYVVQVPKQVIVSGKNIASPIATNACINS